MLKYSWAISHVAVELKTNVFGICISIVRVDVVNDHMSLMCIQSVKSMRHPIGILCGSKAK
jgi:hypothetical protein